MRPSTHVYYIPLLSGGTLRLLARLFKAALTDAGGWVDRLSTNGEDSSMPTSWNVASPAGPAGESTGPVNPLLMYKPLFDELGILPLPGGKRITDPVSVGGSDKPKSDCSCRPHDGCPITLNTETVKHAHIIPHSLANLEDKNTFPFWMMLGICLGPELRDMIFSIVSSDNRCRTTNLMTLDGPLLSLFRNGAVHLVPVGDYGATFEASTCSQYDVHFIWWDPDPYPSRWITTAYENPEDQVREVSVKDAVNLHTGVVPFERVRGGPQHHIVDGNRFRLFTNTPDSYPLPHPLLLDLHAMLWRMLTISGISKPPGVGEHCLAAAIIAVATASGAGAGDEFEDDNTEDLQYQFLYNQFLLPERLTSGAPDDADLRDINLRLNIVKEDQRVWGVYYDRYLRKFASRQWRTTMCNSAPGMMVKRQ